MAGRNGETLLVKGKPIPPSLGSVESRCGSTDPGGGMTGTHACEESRCRNADLDAGRTCVFQSEELCVGERLHSSERSIVSE